ncbi:uncharacterized protein DCS_01222 [Drechmeria coniospora]|uniref:SGNH hydrolase-type esterase domain-containing protein n=1 Tax=Drechmeria coniospora TaxID=98403 RepID=A0A151GSN5_DRECN|nr:uncharacterized protein DCS_01222 [Drechmeria coniospora]KYK60088.1 uncharacterized protein DCS_01222 [Drechmeria coniospora]ODA81401.1 hypothetical protein RJ55_04366 [Drechmeria coniospora]
MAVPYPQVVLLGDSLFEQSVNLDNGFSFQAALQTLCIRRLDVVNRGLSGWNSANVVEHLDRLFPKPTTLSPRIKHLVILLGANDAVIPMPTTTQHVPIDQYKTNLQTIINHPHIRAHEPKILLVTPPPLDEIKREEVDKAAGHPRTTRTCAISASYSDKAREVARENPDVTLVDLWQALMNKAIEMAPEHYTPGGPWLGTRENGHRGGLKELLSDGLHMSGDAYRVFYDEIKPLILDEWAHLQENDRTGYLLPDWRTLNC